jgi:hypothetical protein
MATITKDLMRAIRIDVNSALVAVGQKHGVVLTLGNGTFTADNAHFKLNVAAVSSDGNVITKEAADLKLYQRTLGLTDAQLTQVFTLAGKAHVLCGFRRHATTNPFLIKCIANDKVYLAPRESVLRALGVVTPKLDDFGTFVPGHSFHADHGRD